MVAASEFFQFSNPLFLDAFVAVVLYIVSRLLAKRFPRIAEGIREGSLVFIVFMCYDASRYFALDSEELARANGLKVINFERKVHINIELSMQAFATAHEEFSEFLNHFYLGAHWGGLVIFFVWAYARVIFASQNKMERRRKEYVQARGRFIIMNMIAACSFIAYPCAPPRYFKYLGFKDTILDGGTDVYSGTRRWVNPYAAMPSMHQGYSLLFALTIVLMLRSEILASQVERDEEEGEDIESGKLDATNSGVRAFFDQVRARYAQYHILSDSTRRDSRKLFYISLLPCAFLIYPLFMFVVIVCTGNHFVLDAIAGAMSTILACILYPPVQKAILFVKQNLVQLGSIILSRLSEQFLGVKTDIELGAVKDSTSKSEEQKSFLSTTAAETA